MQTNERVIEFPRPFLLFLGDIRERGYAKTALGLRDWSPGHCVGGHALPGAPSIGLPPLRPRDAQAAGARSLVIGVANPGGVIPGTWIAALSPDNEPGNGALGALAAARACRACGPAWESLICLCLKAELRPRCARGQLRDQRGRRLNRRRGCRR